MESNLSPTFFSSRSSKVPDADRSEPRLDAGSFLLQREGGPLPQHHHAKRVHPHLPVRFGPVQHTNLTDAGLPDEPETLPAGSTGLLAPDGQL